MNRIATAAALALFLTAPAVAEDIGIEFGAMPVGTRLVTETRDADQQRYAEIYQGVKDGLHVVHLAKIKGDGTQPLLATRYFDSEGRLVRTEKKGKLSSSHTPFSCEYVVGQCEHVYVYANPFQNGKLVTHDDSYANRLDQKTLTVALQKTDGSYLEIPYELGEYNLRISSEYTNALGQVRGFRLVELTEP